MARCDQSLEPEQRARIANSPLDDQNRRVRHAAVFSADSKWIAYKSAFQRTRGKLRKDKPVHRKLGLLELAQRIDDHGVSRSASTHQDRTSRCAGMRPSGPATRRPCETPPATDAARP
jgi:hypothetical protein